MSKGFVIFADGKQFVEQAYLCALSIKASKNSYPISLVTSNQLTEKQNSVFEHVIKIPWHIEDKSRFKVDSRRKVYHVSPYESTIVLDSDALVLQNLDYFWKYLENYNLYYPSRVFTYRQEQVNEAVNPYRKAFFTNNLPNLYNAIYYFKKSTFTKEFYDWIEIVINNWELFYKQFCKHHCPKEPSMDLTVAIVSKILDCDTEITNYKQDLPNLVHMKSLIQNWKSPTTRWQDRVGVYLTENLELKIGNHKQSTVFHYTENDFCNKSVIKKYETALCM